jgi:hypothetical protein
LTEEAVAVRAQVARQISHWQAAVVGIQDLDNFAAPAAWRSVEGYLGLGLRKHLSEAVEQLARRVVVLTAQLRAARTVSELEELRVQIIHFRRRYLQVETALDFFGDAVNTRTNSQLASILRACDMLAVQSMEKVLVPLGREVPRVIVYVDKGMGASVLRAGLRLWDGGDLTPAAAIKVTRQNLLRPTSLIHESGHQVAHIVGWNGELAAALRKGLGDVPDVAPAWSGWASEIAADCYAFVCTGYGSVAALHDVVSSGPGVLRNVEGDPHPVAYLRVLLGAQMCVRFYGAGPWDALATAWVRSYPTREASPATRRLIEQSLPLLGRVVDICLRTPMRSFGGKPLAMLIDPAQVRPDALAALSREAGQALFTSPHWLAREGLRLLALSSFQVATEPERSRELAERTQMWMVRLAGSIEQAAA